jgi:hypothetical protein
MTLTSKNHDYISNDNHDDAILIKNVMHILDLLQFIFVIFIQIKNDKELD